MDRRKKQVKERIMEAMIALSARKSWDKITITDIIEESRVARATFYRNFNGIDDLVEYGIEQFRIRYWADAPQDGTAFLRPEMIEYTFAFYYQNRDLILSFCHSGLSTTVLDIITESMILSFGDMPSDSIERYRLYYCSGALYNTMIQWIETGAKETPAQMAAAFLNFS